MLRIRMALFAFTVFAYSPSKVFTKSFEQLFDTRFVVRSDYPNPSYILGSRSKGNSLCQQCKR